nr:flagellar basal body L-ring protein FlgH [Caballeronia sp. BR00000012568055]
MLAACSSSGSRSIVEMPTFAPTVAQPVNVNTQGAIFQAGNAYSLYETPRAQKVGDVLTIRLAESYQGSNKANAEASRASSISAEAADKSSGAAARLARLFNVGSASTSFKGEGSTSNISAMSGTLAVSIIGTLPGGNLVVAGDKVIAMDGNQDRMRFSGIVNPRDIEAGNYVASNKVANARIEQAGVGMLADSTTMGWLQKLFMSVLTF